MRRSERNKGKNLDYKLFAKTGERSTTTTTCTMEPKSDDDGKPIVSNAILVLVITDEIEDVMCDNDPESIENSSELMMNCFKKTRRFTYSIQNATPAGQTGNR